MPLEDELTIGPEAWIHQEVTTTTTPDFVKKRAAGELPVNYFFWTRQEGQNPITETQSGSQQYGAPQQGFASAVVGGSMSSPDGFKSCIDLDTLHALARDRLRTKVTQATLEGGLNLAEYRKTSAFVSAAMVKTAQALRHARRGNVRGVWNTLTGGKPLKDAVSDGWLAFTYAFKPLAYDVATAVELLEEGLYLSPIQWSRTLRVFPVRVSGVARYPTSQSGKSINGFLKYGGGVQYRVDEPVVATLSALGFTNPALIAWELVPYSFVVDWFIPIGKFLTQIGPPKGTTFIKGYTIVKGEGACRLWASNPAWDLSANTKEIVKERRPLDDFPRPSLRIPDLDLSKEQIASGLALLQQRAR